MVGYYLWESSGTPAKPFSITSHASNCFAMVFNYKEPYQVYNQLKSGASVPNQFLSGHSTGPYTLVITQEIGVAGIIFRGAAFRNLFSIDNLPEFMNDRLDLTNWLGKEAAFISEKLADAGSHLRRIQVLETFLLDRLKRNDQNWHFADEAASIIINRRGMVRMDELAAKLCVSPRQLRRVFKARVGMNPKYFARLKRFSYVNLCLTKNPDISWRSFIADEAFYDQSHFIKDYKEFFGKNPTAQIQKNRALVKVLSK